MCNQTLTIYVNIYIFLINIYTHFHKYKYNNYKLPNIIASENINISKSSNIKREVNTILVIKTATYK